MIRLAIVGCGNWANRHAQEFQKIRGVTLLACADFELAKAEAFARKYAIPHVYSDYKAMFRQNSLDAVTVVVNDGFHAPAALAAIRRGLHVLCEKPLATTTKDADRMLRAAKQKKIIHMVNFSYRESSALQKARQLVQTGRLGNIVHVEASYLQSWLTGKMWGDWRKGDTWLWRMAKSSGSGGALADIGCHILDFTTYVVGDIRLIYCRLGNFDKGVKNNSFRGYKLDANESALMNVEFENRSLGVIHLSRWATGRLNDLSLRVYGSKGAFELLLQLNQPWDRLRVCSGPDIDRCEWKTIACGKPVNNYTRFIQSIRTGENASPSFEDGAKIQRYLEACFRSDSLQKPVRM